MTQVPSGGPGGPAVAAGQPKMSGMAVASLICAFLGLCTAGLGGIAGLILGLVALSRISRSGGTVGGRGMAIAGTVISGISLFLVVGAMLVSAVILPQFVGQDGEATDAVTEPLSDQPSSQSREQLTLDLAGSTRIKLVLIPAGKFLMGSPESEKERDDNEGPQHEVTISKPFYMGVTPVTQAQYESVMGTNPSHFRGATNPVEQVSWDDAEEFCKKLSEKTRQTVRLPTEAEREYACRAGTTTRFSFGDQDSALGDHAWYGVAAGHTHPVAQKKPNLWGLYDMHGNVWEWCADWFGDYPAGAATDPQGPASGEFRVLRGGVWFGGPHLCRSAARNGVFPDAQELIYGFRVVVTAAAP